MAKIETTKMINALENLKLLVTDMKQKGWYIDVFSFKYKQIDYFVIVRLYEKPEMKPTKYALCEVEFLVKVNLDDALAVPANSKELFVDAKTLREYFKIEYAPNLGDILKQFYVHLGSFIPVEVRDKTPEQKHVMVRSLSKSDSEDPEKIYCFKVKRDPKRKDGSPGQRSPYNDNKTRILRPALYQKLKDDHNLSFCFSINPDDEKDDSTILGNLKNNQAT